MLSKSTLQLLRFHFSVFLMPVFWFALSQVSHINWSHAILAFFILHLLVYPASNGYNSYMDQDTGSIGGIEKPLPPTRQLLFVTIVMNLLAIIFSFFISPIFAGFIALYILFSTAYSYRGIRLKKYPITGFLTVVIFQGAVTYYMTKHAASVEQTLFASIPALLGSSFLIAAFYPLTQIYQHVQDKADGVETISAKLGYRGSFLFSALMFLLASCFLGYYFMNNLELDYFLLIQVIMLPVLVFFFWWMHAVWKNQEAANFKNTMRMNIIASICTNAAFIIILILNQF